MTDTPIAKVSSGTPRSNSRLVAWQAAMAGLSYVAGAGALTDILPAKWSALFFVVIGGLQAGTAAYVAGVRPVETPVQVVTMDVHQP